MKKIFAVTAVLLLLFLLASCGCDHDWEEATCTDPKYCTLCDLTEGEKLGHDWQEPTCTIPKTCARCDKEKGDPLGHDWADATCTVPKTCSVCNATEGEALGHDWMEATCTTPKACTVCEAVEGEVSAHVYTSAVTATASCQTTGETTYTCESCNDFYTETYDLPIYTATDIFDMYEGSVGEVLTYKKNGAEYAIGTCFVYSTDGKLITNYHVIEGAYSAKVTLDGTEYTVKKVLAYDKAIDIAVIQISASNLKPVVLCDNTHKVGETVYAFGSSRGLTGTLSEGIITHANRVMDDVSYTQHDAAISGGNSGGPLINKFGEVIAINTWTVRDSQNLNFAINVSELDNLVYGTVMTMAQLYEKESNPYEALKNYIAENGEYDSDGYYYLYLGECPSDSLYIDRYAYYYPDDGEITLDLIIEDGEDYYWTYITLTAELSGTYDWTYFNGADEEMYGTVYAGSFTEDTILSYNSTNVSSGDLYDTRELASTMISLSCLYITDDFAEIGVTAADLGFVNY